MSRLRRVSELNKHPSQTRWMVSYADYMTLMFALFVVLYAKAIVKEDSFNVLSESFGKVFHISGDKGKGTTGDGLLTNQTYQAELLDGNNLLPEKGPELTRENLSISESLDKKVGKPLQALKHEMQTALLQLTENGLAKFELDDDWLTIELNSGMLFPSGSASASPAASIILSQIAKVLSSGDNLIEIRGYTDSLAINNEIFSSNWQLSAARAASVTNLLEKFGIAQQRLGIKANGSNNPIASNETVDGRAKNRRVVIALSRYAFESNELSDNKAKLQQELTDKVTEMASDEDEIQVIKLPHGGLRITTRKDQKRLQDNQNQ
ncbi:cell envelope biogenesis protein OmpA [Psychrosphaera saromensis]|uniref:OmpA-like domain-containing protein n=1 Tax=Psychrosphaera saromensis TaxID=716813 RepID=A0A2S7UV29_9GAMM|nr:OmpA family protein [Psychrosphaera saromensis]PQJ53793.1 hypothetical protein BTO11_09040 [Psychrosphaera saromensis]GHB62259.1 cell envelope biogenesis protein OmpA [Psychrosphaera saromensis]GLQ15417.1 cell envelope biogenesis protein OmpA [Psychrosphaera saromensis]